MSSDALIEINSHNQFDNIPLITQPTDINIPLYQHQLASVYQMELREQDKQIIISSNSMIETNIGINCDTSGYGKCLGYDTPIIMYDGTVKMVQDIKINDLLMGDDSSPRKVLSLARGVEQMYKISQNIGDAYIVNSSHILSLCLQGSKYMIKYENSTHVKYFCKKSMTFLTKIFDTFNDAKKYMSEIHIDNKIDICIEDYLKLPDNIRRRLKGYKTGSIKCWKNSLTDNEMDPFRFGYLCTKTHIPYVYKINTQENRSQLLEGIVYNKYDHKCRSYIIKPKNTSLTNDIKYLCNSLNIRYSIKHGDIYIKIVDLRHVYKSNKIWTNINIEKLGIDNYYGFSIDNNHRFLLGDFTVTHNTLSMVTLLHRNKMEWNMETPYVEKTTDARANGYIKKTDIKEYKKIDATLILVSHSIINQWYKELQKSTLCIRMMSKKSDIENTVLDNYDVILITPTMYNFLVIKYYNMAWKRFVYDEPAHIKVSKMIRIIAGFYWFVTSTPDIMWEFHRKNKISFMYSMISGNTDWIHFLEYLKVKNRDDFIKHSYEMPAINHYYIKCHDPMYKTVENFVTSKIREMISAGNIHGAIRALGGSETSNIAELVRKKKLDEIEEMEYRIRLLEIRNKKDQIATLHIAIDRIKQQITEIDMRYKEIIKRDCNICMDSLEQPVLEPNCQNVFCGGCIIEWLKTKNTCPLCRVHISPSTLIVCNIDAPSSKNGKKEIDETRPKTKIETTLEIIRKNQDNKFIIFSAWDQTFFPIRESLKHNNINYVEVRGSVTACQKNIDRFKTGDTNVIFLNSKFNGSGINLQEATDIIIYHEMDASMISQIIGRANRIGRKNPLNVHYLQI